MGNEPLILRVVVCPVNPNLLCACQSERDCEICHEAAEGAIHE